MGRLMKILAGAALATATPAYADDLHGFCSPACPDLGAGHSQTSANPPVFGFSAASGPTTGALRIDILVPSTLAQPSSYTILMGGNPFTASLFNATPWSSGQLDAYLGITASPTNPIGAYGGASSYLVYQALLGTVTAPAQGSPGSPYLSFAAGTTLLQGTYILAFMDTDLNSSTNTLLATPNSAAILEVGPPVPEPATWAMMLLGFGSIGMALRRSRKANGRLAQFA